ncbi:hypothetical protein RGUI_0191 [Rhodovulum sp. P5]|uniref:hypothetical protein n=1 Tax=Rhodovulum sp. P5 TaxID=1564506 RepID=UPI0009C2565E|nr:hypothetical protein [Rhodovulum sp. P5]ARE38332.1 hypothetical protein RGUI_0191 [Rhodovulum sp. P5]
MISGALGFGAGGGKGEPSAFLHCLFAFVVIVASPYLFVQPLLFLCLCQSVQTPVDGQQATSQPPLTAPCCSANSDEPQR